MVGQTIAHYQVLEKLGEGGMGVVYKARDTHLDRFVAIKVLTAEKVADSERKRRFVQEAKAASALNHPNIVHIYDIDQQHGVDFMAMEFVPGKTLGQLIGRKGLPLGEILRCAEQIAGALAAAHAAGIVHRDLKPGNVMVSGDGRVRVLDFGLAKLTEPIGGEAATVTALTAEGAIVGTVAYMSPEQAQGQPVDARSDIFSFGAMLYEMLTGRRAFQGDTKMSTLAAIIHKEPEPLSAEVPMELGRIITRCLRKDPARRWQTMADLKVALQELKEESDSGKLAATVHAPAARTRRLRLGMPLALLLAAVVAGVALWVWRGVRPSGEVEIARLTYDPGLTWEPSISPDGKLATYASDRSGEGNFDIWVQQITGRQPMRLTRHEADDWQPSFSPDGSRIAFRSERDGGGIYVTDALGGIERKLVDGGYYPRFSPDGSFIAYLEVPASGVGEMASGPGNRIYLVPVEGGPPQPFQSGFRVVRAVGQSTLVWSPDGRFLLFDGIRARDRRRDWWVAPVGGGEPVATGALENLRRPQGIRHPCAWAGRHVFFAEGTMAETLNIFRVPVAPGTWQIRGPAERLTSGAGAQMAASIATDGRMLFPNVQAAIDIWSVKLEPNRARTSGEPQPVTRDSAMKFGLSASRDGSRLAYVLWAGAGVQRRLEIRLRDMASGAETPVAPRAMSLLLHPLLSPDGSVFSYRDQRDGKWYSYAVSGDNAPARQLCEGCTVFAFFSAPHQGLVAYASNELVRQNFAAGSQVGVLKTPLPITEAVLSPDDRWVAFATLKPEGAAAIYLVPLKEPPVAERDWIGVAEDRRHLSSPQWSPDGKLLYYVSARDGSRCVWAQPFDPAAGKLAGEAVPVFHSHRPPAIKLMPPSGWSIAVTSDRLIFTVGEVKGNIWTAKVEVK